MDNIKKLKQIYYGIKQRCGYEKHNRYKNYGGRGIKCEWDKFEDFYNDMVSMYEDGLTIDRIDTNGNYSKNNCRWSTQKTQANNRTNNILLEYNGEILTIVQWAERLGYKRGILQSRYRKGWDHKKIIETPRFTKTVKRVLSKLHKENISMSMMSKNKKKITTP